MSKRTLYKPAMHTEVMQQTRGRTKPLAQGRLVTDPDPRSTEITDDIAQSERTAGQQTTKDMSLGRTARRNLSSLVTTESLNKEFSLNPRQTLPHASPDKSAPYNQPSDSLDLSDDDLDQPEPFRRGSPPSVMMIDASQQEENLANTSEINVQMEFVHSPARVVRHAPSRVGNSLQTTGDVEVARKIAVDDIHTVLIQGSPETMVQRMAEDRRPKPHSPPAKAHSPPKGPFICLPTNTESPVTAVTTEICAKALFRAGSEDDLGLAHDIKDLNISGTTEGSLDALETERTNDPAQMKATKSRTQQPKTKSAAISTADIRKKKKEGRVVQSRYMQPTQAPVRKGPVKATDRSILTKTNMSSKSTTSVLGVREKRGPSSAKKKRPHSFSNHSNQQTPSSLSITPETRGQGGKVSTPAADGSLFHAPEINMSVIVGAGPSVHQRLSYSSGNLSETHQSNGSSHRHQKSLTLKSNKPFHTPTRNTSRPKFVSRVSQKQLDMTYARYMQWVYLNSRAKKAFQEQEKQFMHQIYLLHQENERLEKRKYELDLEFARVVHVDKLDRCLETQATGLASVGATLPNHRKQYSALAQAVDTTRHQMAAKGVFIPSDQEQYANAIMQALRESEQLLGEISVLVEPTATQLSTSKQSIKTLENILHEELQELSDCTKLLAATQTLTTQECALQIQQIQHSEVIM